MREWTRSRNVAIAFGVLIVLAAQTLPAREDPKWELGLGLAAIAIPDYRGSDESHAYVLPFPFVTYRSEYISVDREGVLGRVFRTERIRVTLSGNAGVPVRGDRETARTGMPDLLPTLEIGPSLEMCLRIECGGAAWKIRLPLRAVIATDLTAVEGAGWVFNPNLDFDSPVDLRGDRWKFGIAAGLVFASERYHDYYYEVAPPFATAARPVFDADGGYSGIRIGIRLSGQRENLWSAVFLRYDNLAGAKIEDSPLVRTRHALTAGVSAAWIFKRSGILVRGDD